jgi:hypothetical protein
MTCLQLKWGNNTHMGAGIHGFRQPVCSNSWSVFRYPLVGLFLVYGTGRYFQPGNSYRCAGYQLALQQVDQPHA